MKNIIRKLTATLMAVVMLVVCAVPFGATEVTTTEISPNGVVTEEPEMERPEIPEECSAIAVDAKSGAVLYENNAYMQRPMASTTKIMTALLALESGDIGREIVINEDMLAYDEPGSTKLGLVLGDHITLYDLVVAMLLLSGNDCAQSVAVALAGSYDNFASMMNQRASEIGMLDTHFITPSGLDDDAHFSTAYDMALLGIEAMKNEDFANICRMQTATVWFGNPMTAHSVSSHNYLLEGMPHGVKGCDGIKTGHTWNAGYCLVSHCERDGAELVCVTLGVPTYWAYQADIYEYAFSQYKKIVVDDALDNDQLMVIGGSKQTAQLTCDTSQVFSVPKNQVGELTYKIEQTKFEYAPISKGQHVGWKRYYYGTLEVAAFPIYAAENVDCVTNDWLSAYIDAIKYNMD